MTHNQNAFSGAHKKDDNFKCLRSESVIFTDDYGFFSNF